MEVPDIKYIEEQLRAEFNVQKEIFENKYNQLAKQYEHLLKQYQDVLQLAKKNADCFEICMQGLEKEIEKYRKILHQKGYVDLGFYKQDGTYEMNWQRADKEL